MKSKCLFVEDNIELRKEVAKELRISERIGEVIETASGEEALEYFIEVDTGDEALEKLNHPKPKLDSQLDLVLLDFDLSGDLHGMEVLREIRNVSAINVLVLTSDNSPARQNEATKAGATGYMHKTFYEGPIEIRQYVENFLDPDILPSRNNPKYYSFEGWTLEVAQHRLINPDDAEIDLTGREFDILLIFVRNPQTVLSLIELMVKLGPSAPRGKRPQAAFTKTLSRLRNKIDRGRRKDSLIVNVHGQGFRFAPDVKPHYPNMGR